MSSVIATAADDKPGVDADAIAATLATEIAAFKTSLQSAQKELGTAITRQKEISEADKRLKVEDLIKLMDVLKAEDERFRLDPTQLPESEVLKPAVIAYYTAIGAAKKKGETAYTVAAEHYRAAMPPNLEAAKTVLAAKAEFLKQPIFEKLRDHDKLREYEKDPAKYFQSKKWTLYEGDKRWHKEWTININGMIEGSEHREESQWKYDDKGHLLTLDGKGKPTDRFTKARVVDGRIILTGTTLNEKKVRTFELRELPPK